MKSQQLKQRYTFYLPTRQPAGGILYAWKQALALNSVKKILPTYLNLNVSPSSEAFPGEISNIPEKG